MGKLPIYQVTPGMVLEEVVTGRNGRMLLAAGVELTNNHLMILRTWGIQEAAIEGWGEDSSVTCPQYPAEVTIEQLETAKTELLPLFRHTDLQESVMMELLNLAAIRKVQHG